MYKSSRGPAGEDSVSKRVPSINVRLTFPVERSEIIVHKQSGQATLSSFAQRSEAAVFLIGQFAFRTEKSWQKRRFLRSHRSRHLLRTPTSVWRSRCPRLRSTSDTHFADVTRSIRNTRGPTSDRCRSGCRRATPIWSICAS